MPLDGSTWEGSAEDDEHRPALFNGGAFLSVIVLSCGMWWALIRLAALLAP
jgi:hypothetical protein